MWVYKATHYETILYILCLICMLHTYTEYRSIYHRSLNTLSLLALLPSPKSGYLLVPHLSLSVSLMLYWQRHLKLFMSYYISIIYEYI